MIERIRTFCHDRILEREAPGVTDQDAVRRATAALLVEVMVTDRHLDATEIERIPALLRRRFQIADAEARELVALAHREVEESTSLYQFTALVNEHFSATEKYSLVRSLWEVAYADGELDKYEEALIRHIAELIHVPHTRFIKARNEARAAVGRTN